MKAWRRECRLKFSGEVTEDESARQYEKVRDPLQNLIYPAPSPGLRANPLSCGQYPLRRSRRRRARTGRALGKGACLCPCSNIRTVTVRAATHAGQLPTGGMRLWVAIRVPSPAGRAQPSASTQNQVASGLPSPGSAQGVLSITKPICAQSRRRDGRDEVLPPKLCSPLWRRFPIDSRQPSLYNTSIEYQ